MFLSVRLLSQVRIQGNRSQSVCALSNYLRFHRVIIFCNACAQPAPACNLSICGADGSQARRSAESYARMSSALV